MPIVIILVALAVIGGGVFFFSGNEAEAPTEAATEELIENESPNGETEPDGEIDETEESMDDTSEDAMMDETGDVTDTTGTDATPTGEQTSVYESGTYVASAVYRTPRQTTHSIDIELELENDIITDVSVIYDDKDAGETSNNYQSTFDEALDSQVVGKNIDEVNLGRVGGSSLTPEAFNDALDDVKEQAQA